AGALASCAPLEKPPEAVAASNPTVTYNYEGDEQLLAASQKASVFCSQYQTVPRTVDITDNPDGTDTVVFECVPAPQTAAVAPPPASPNLSYIYRTDEELLPASRNAEAYCMRYGPRMTSTIVTNADGTRTVTFRCTPA
ncbi:MAG TPA: hypothetical protein VIR38_05555, partial [Thalassobaculum sp.]